MVFNKEIILLIFLLIWLTLLKKMILKILAKHNLKVKEFIEFIGVSRGHFFYAIKKNNLVYIKGLEVKLVEFINYKIIQLEKESNEMINYKKT